MQSPASGKAEQDKLGTMCSSSVEKSMGAAKLPKLAEHIQAEGFADLFGLTNSPQLPHTPTLRLWGSLDQSSQPQRF